MKKIKPYLKFYSYSFVFFSIILCTITRAAESRPTNFVSFQTGSVVKSFQTNSSPPKRKKERKTKQRINQMKLVSVAPSSWGATGIGLVVGENGVKIEYDCAGGEIEKKLMIDKNGNFNVEGVHIPFHGGPVRIDEQPKRQPARYEGKISGNRMTLKVILTESKKTIGEFTLERDKTPIIRRCL